MLNGRFVLEEEYRERKENLDKKTKNGITWTQILKKGFDICEMEAEFKENVEVKNA